MTQHASHRLSPESLAAFRSLDVEGRRQRILDVYRESFQPLTDREVMHWLGFVDPNCVRPRASELLNEGKIVVHSKVIDAETGAKVRRCTIPGRFSPPA